jgi:hypothetical protein
MTTPPPHNPKQPDIEEALRQGERFLLRSDERAQMRAALLSHAAFHSTQPATSPAPAKPAVGWWRYITATVTAFSLIMVVTVSASAHQSLPGDHLYPLKVQVIEPLVVSLQNRDLSVSEQTNLLLERRLSEVKQLEETNTLSDVAAASIAEMVTAHTQVLIEEISDPRTPPSTTRDLLALDTAAALIDAHQELLESAAATTLATLAETETAFDVAYTDEVSSFPGDHASTTLSSYIDSSLSTIERELTTSDLPTTTLATIEDFVDTASTSLANADLIDAHDALAEAQQLLLVEDFIDGTQVEEN